MGLLGLQRSTLAVKTADVIVLHVGQYQGVVLWSINLDLEMRHKSTKVGVNECKLCQYCHFYTTQEAR